MKPPDVTVADLALDLTLAANTSLPVLISARQDDAMRLAAEIAGNGANGGRLHAVDAADLAEFIHLLTCEEPAPSHRRRTVVLRDVDTLDCRQQDALTAAVIARCRAAAPCGWRLITTTSGTLTDPVIAARFAPRLFYLLNAIHIVA